MFAGGEADGFRAVGDVELAEDREQMEFDAGFREPEFAGYVVVGEPARERTEYLKLARRERWCGGLLV